MESALRIYSLEHGFLKEEIAATKVKSSSHARKIGPFKSKDGDHVFWVGWGKEKLNGKRKVAHFRKYPSNKQERIIDIGKQFKKRKKASGESPQHEKAKIVIKELLLESIRNNQRIPWAFKDPEISDFPLTGDLLSEATSVELEYEVKTPLGKNYVLDVAILGEAVVRNPVVLAAIEVEFTHKFDITKAMACKCIGFPLISLDIRDMGLEEIDKKWARQSIIETTRSGLDGKRKNYFYLCNILSTMFIDIPREIEDKARHQYLIFSKDRFKLNENIRAVVRKLKLSSKQVSLHLISNSNIQTEKQIRNAGLLAGEGWDKIDSEGYIQLTVDKPITKSGSLYIFHFVISALCNSVFDCMVGYRYRVGEHHEPDDGYIWKNCKKIDGELKWFKFAPKCVSEPVGLILDALNSK